MSLRARDHCTSSTLIGGKGGAGWSKFTTLRLRDQQSKRTCKVYIDFYVASNASCFMVSWTIFENRLLEGGLTQNWEIMAFLNLMTVDLLYFVMCEDILK